MSSARRFTGRFAALAALAVTAVTVLTPATQSTATGNTTSAHTVVAAASSDSGAVAPSDLTWG